MTRVRQFTVTMADGRSFQWWPCIGKASVSTGLPCDMTADEMEKIGATMNDTARTIEAIMRYRSDRTKPTVEPATQGD